METTPRRALGYPRVSTEDQGEKFGRDVQEGQIRELCAAKGWQLVGVIPDDFTGSTLDRPGYTRVRELAAAKAFDVLVCARIDRLARKNHLRRLAEVELAEHGIEVVFAKQHFENNAVGRFQRGVMGEVAELEAELIRERTMGGRDEKASGNPQKGVLPAIPVHCQPYGYRQVSTAEAKAVPEYHGRGGELILLPEKVPFLVELFQRAAAGQTLRSLAAWADTTGHKTKGGGAWTPMTVRTILKNPVYYGEAAYGRRHIVTLDKRTKSGKRLATREERLPESEWKRIPCPAVVSRELWEAVSARLAQNKSGRAGRPSTEWPLSGGVTVCGVCLGKRGHGLNVCGHKTPDGRRFYNCASRVRRDMPFCGTRYQADALEEMARQKIRDALTPGRLGALARQEAEEANKAAGNPEQREKVLRAQLAALNEETESVFERAKYGFDASFIQQKVSEINASRGELERELATVRAQAAHIRCPAAAAREAEAAGATLAENLEETLADPARFKALARRLLRITLTPNQPPDIDIIVPRSLA